jgi:hypothetical protein
MLGAVRSLRRRIERLCVNVADTDRGAVRGEVLAIPFPMPDAPAVINMRWAITFSHLAEATFLVAVLRAIPQLSFAVRGDPSVERVHEVSEKCAGPVVDEVTISVEQLVGVVEINLRLSHRWNVQKHQRLRQVMVCSKFADAARRRADDCALLATPCVMAIRP